MREACGAAVRREPEDPYQSPRGYPQVVRRGPRAKGGRLSLRAFVGGRVVAAARLRAPRARRRERRARGAAQSRAPATDLRAEHSLQCAFSDLDIL